MPNKIDALYSEVSKTYDVGSIQDFEKYLSDPNKRKLFFKEVIAPEYDVKSIDDFDEAYGFKKKSTESLGQQQQKDIFSVSGETPKVGPSEPSAKKSPTLQEQLQASVNLAAGALVASSKPGYKPVPKEEADKALYGKAAVQSGTLRGIPGETKSTVQNLNEKYKGLGVNFEEAPSKIQKAFGLGDIVVTADDGSTHIVQSTGSDEKLREEEAKLQTFLMGKSAGVEKKPVSPMEFLMMSRDGISPQEENKFKRVYSQELVDSSIKFANNELEKTKSALDNTQAEISKLNQSAMVSGVTPEIESRFSELQDEYEKNIKYARSIASLTDEGVKQAAGENARLMAENGNVAGGLYNALLNGTKMLVEGSADIIAEGMDIATLGAIGDVNPSGSTLYTYDKKKAREERSAFLNEIYNELKDAGTTKEYTTTGNMAWKALFSVPEFIPSLVVPGGASARIASMWSQGVGRRYEEMDSNPETKSLPEEEKFFMAAGPAYVEARLENFGLTQWLGANKGLASSIFLRAVSKVAPEAGVKGLNKLINAEINNLVLQGAVNTAGAMITEAETGALQNISETAFRDAYEIAKEKNLFKQPGFTDAGFKKALLEDAMMEGLGGMWMAGAVNIAQQTENYVTGKTNTNETFRLVKEILSNKTTTSSLITTLKSQIIDGKISKEKAQNVLNNFNEARAIVRELPSDLSEDNQRAAFDLVAEKRKLTKQIEGKDPSLVNKQKNRISEIDKQLIEISNAVQEQTTSEVPVQPEARVGGEVAQGEPQAESQVPAEENLSKEEVELRQKEAESKIKRKDLFSDGGTFSNILGGSGVNSVPTSHSEIGGIEFVQFSNPNTGQVDVIMTGTSDSDFVGFYRIYENGRPTNKWSSKFENQSRNKDNFKTMISGVQSMLPEGHEYTEKTSISTDGLRIWNQQLDRGYELQYDKNGNIVTNEVAINGDAISNELGIEVSPGDFQNISVTTNDQFNRVKSAILPYLSKMGLSEKNIKWEDGTVKIDLPVLAKTKPAEEVKAKEEVIPAGKRLFNEPNPETVEISRTYKEENGIAEPEGVKIESVDAANASKIADAYDALEDSPNDPEVQKAYSAMADETAKQHQAILDAGYEVELWQGEGEPYANAQEMIYDVKNNKHMYIYSTEQGFGDKPITEEQRKQNKLLQDSGFKDKNGNTLLYNDLFRFVHDFFGHTERGNGFGPVGEENAWDVHARMYTPKARRAMTTETRGQNSWVNFGPQMRNADGSLKKKGDEGYLSPQERQFAPQKMALMPEEFSQITEVTSNFDEAVNKSAQALNVVAPDLKVIVGENIDDVQNRIVEAIAPLVGERQALQTAEEFATGTKGQTIFVDGKPFAVVFDKTTADSRTAGHEAWEVMLNDAFGNDQAKFKEFTDSIDSQLRAQGFDEIADKLDAFASQKGYEAVKYSEYMAELGGMLVESGFGKGPLTAQQKTLLQKIGDIINKFAELFTGKKQFLDQATPEDILGFMVTISNKVAKGEDVSQFFRTTENTETIKDTNKVLTNRSQKIGDFDIQYFEDDAQFKDLIDRGLVVQNASIDEAAGQPVATHQPDNLLVGNVNYKGKQIMEGNGGIYYVLKFGNVWASGKQSSAKTLANYINKSRKESTDGIGRMVLVRGSQDKMISSVQGVKAAMRILEELVFDNLISTSDFRKALTAAGKTYNIDFSGSNSAKQIQKDIEDKFMNVSDSTFARRGDFFSKLVDEIGKLDSAKKNIKEIQKALGATKNIQFSKGGIRQQIGTVLTERLLIGLDSGNAYAIVEVDEDVEVKKDDQHPSYPFSIVTKSGKPPVLKVFNYRPKAVEAIRTMSGEQASNAKLGLAQMGMGMGRIASDKGVVVKSRSQKAVPPVVDEVLTDDGKGNYLFVHYSDDTRDVIKPMAGSKRNFTSREEVSAISSVGGVAMYYTKAGQKENGVGDVPHTVLVPKDKVYFYGTTDKGTVSHDPEGFEAEARRRFQEYKNRGNEKNPTVYAFDSNNAAAWVTKVAGENGYDMVVTNWGGPKSYRAQTTKTLKAEDEYTGFKKPEPVVFEVGDEIFVSGSYGNVTAVNGSLVRYEGTNQYGGAVSGVFDTNRNNGAIMIEKAKPVITVRAQKKSDYTDEQYSEMSRNGILFHAGSSAIEKLDPSKIKGGARARYGWGVYFASTIFKASEYGSMITFLDSKQLNFLDISSRVTDELISELEKVKDKDIYYDLFISKMKGMIGVNINDARNRMSDFIRWDYDELWSNMFMDAGYDGFNQVDYEYVVFNMDKADQAIVETPLKVTTRAQKVEVKTIPGYDRMMNEVEGIMDKTMNRGGSYNQASANAINYLQKSAVYEKADDIQREQIIRDFKKIRGEKFKVAPSVAKIMGQIKDVKEVTVKESTALKDQIKLEAKAARESAAFVKQLRMDISNQLKSMVGRGVISARQATAIISRYDKMNILNPVMRDRFVDYMSRVFQSAEYTDKIKEASKIRASIKKAMKSPANQAEIAKLAKNFADIDPARVENIDDYINNATQMLNAVARKTGDPLMRSLVNAADMNSYIDTEIESQREQIKNELLDKYKELVDAGVLSSDMTINEIKKIVAAIEENEGESVAKEEKAKAAVKEMMAEVSPFIVQIVKTGEDPFTGEPIVLTQDEKKSLIALTKMDTDSLSLSEAVQVLEYANNFVANGITSGIDGMVSLYQGGLNAGELVDDGFKAIPLSKYLSEVVGRVWGEGFATLPMLNKLLWGNTRRAIMVSEKAGINGVSNGKAKALKMVDTAVKQYVKQFSKVKDFLASENVIERGVFAFMSRNVIGDEFQVQDEFNRRKTLIEETIQALKDVDNNTDAEIKKGEVIQKVYDKVLKDAKNINDVKKNVSQINQEAVNWWIKKWSENFDRIDEVSRNVYNTELSRDIDFTPDRFQLKEAPTAVEEDFDSGFFGNFEYVDTSKSGSLRKNNRISNLPKDKNGVKRRIVNLDFDVNNVNALTSAMVDVETASSVMQMKGFVTSKNFSKLFSNKDDKNLYKKRLIKYVNRAKGGSYVDQNELAKINRFINTIASFGVAKALFSVSQPFKQFIPPMLNTLSQTGRFDIGELFNGAMEFIDKSGYPIANRGVASQGELKSINRQLVEAEKNAGVRILDFFANISNKALELTLKNPDVYAARASWISFYLKGLQKQGQSTSNIDWSTHQINKEAADYAQAMVDSQQNISDTDMQGEIFASKQPATVFLRRAILPLMTFTLNQKTRVWSDIRTLSNDVSSKEDKMEAAKSLTGALVELAAFQGVALAFKELYNTVANAIMGEDEDEEEKKIRRMRQSQSTAQAFMKDFFLPPVPGMDIYASKGINYLLDETGLSEELPYKWFGIQDEEQKYRLYDKFNIGYLDMLGTQGIAAEKALDLAGYYDAAIDGEFSKEYNGNEVKKALMEEDLDVARMNAVIMTAYYGGLLPSDMAYIANVMNKKIQKRAEQIEKD